MKIINGRERGNNMYFFQIFFRRVVFIQDNMIPSSTRPETPGRPGGPWGPWPPLFCIAKRRKGNKEKKIKNLKSETIKKLSPRSKCYIFSHSRGSRIQNFFLLANHDDRQYCLVFHGPSTLKFISPALTSRYFLIYKYVSSMAIFNYNLARFLCFLLSPEVSNDYSCKECLSN